MKPEDNIKYFNTLHENERKIKLLRCANKKLFHSNQNKDKWSQLIIDIGYDYDGCRTVEGLQSLVDELVEYAHNSLQDLDFVETMYVEGEDE